jgi:hypothetical protein
MTTVINVEHQTLIDSVTRSSIERITVGECYEKSVAEYIAGSCRTSGNGNLSPYYLALRHYGIFPKSIKRPASGICSRLRATNGSRRSN